MNELNGTVKEIFDEQTFAGGFNKKEFVVTDDADKYPQDIKFQCVKDKVALVNKLNRGDRVKVTFNIRGNEHQGRYFVNLDAWKIEVTSQAQSKPAEPHSDFAANDEPLNEDVPF